MRIIGEYPVVSHAWVGKPSILSGMDVGVTEIDTQNVNDAKQEFS